MKVKARGIIVWNNNTGRKRGIKKRTRAQEERGIEEVNETGRKRGRAREQRNRKKEEKRKKTTK